MLMVVLNLKYFVLPLMVPQIPVFPVFDGAAVVPHFHGEGEGNVQYFSQLHPSTAIFGQNLVSVPTVHLPGREIAPLVTKAGTLF